MKIFKEFEPSPENCGIRTVATLGTFDGVHVGHRKIFEHVVAHAKTTGKEAVVLTFDKHPVSVIKPDVTPNLLTTLREKLEMFKESGIESTYILNFTKQISEMTAEQFIEKYLICCLGMEYFVAGYDHGFGKGRAVSPEKLQEYARKFNFKLEILQPVTYEGIIIKSSAIREYVLKGTVDLASALLGYDYSLQGDIVEGRGIGKKIGFPTANMVPKNGEKIIPATGVYSGWIKFENVKKDALITVGPSPTFNYDEELIEIHIPNYDGNLYGKSARIGFVKRMRDIEKFGYQKELVQQIKNDIEKSKHFITNYQ